MRASAIAPALQILGAAAVVVGIGFAFGYALGLVAAGAALVAFGVAVERGR